ncbi:MAG: Pvc16 family protein [Myxococcota bacterium]|nr:Pvc16 family protein [Myxococcota bacterium]
MTNLAELPQVGPMSGKNLVGEVTESIHKFLLDGYDLGEQPPRFEEDLKFVPKDREEVIYIYMYRVARNANLSRQKRYRQAPVFVNDTPSEDGGSVYYHRPPMLLDLFYLLLVHSKFRSDAERLLGWMMLRLNEATHLIYRPRRFVLPGGDPVDSLGRPYNVGVDLEEDGLVVEKVSLDLVDDLTVGDAINFYTLHEAPYRPFLTYRARVALDGPLVASQGGTTVRLPPAEVAEQPDPRQNRETTAGRIKGSRPTPRKTPPVGPDPHFVRRAADPTDPEPEG